MNEGRINPRITILANASLGGTEKAATIYATQLAARGYHVDYLASRGPRIQFLESQGVRVLEKNRSEEDLYNYIVESRPDIIHQHVPGYPVTNNLYPALRRISCKQRPKIIETNIFGRLEDPRSDEFVDFRMFISMASAAQAFRRARVKNIRPFLNRHTVVYYPVPTPSEFEPEKRRTFRQQLGVAPNQRLAVRVGRPSHKWAAWECRAYAMARDKAECLQLLVMQPPTWLERKIRTGEFGDGIIILKETSDFEWLEQLYASADLMIHSSDWGESFGYTIAEGMAAGLPVITRSTPWCDNAQVELVKNGESGFVCWSVPEMARRLIELANDESQRSEMGTAASKRIQELAGVDEEVEVLEEVIKHCLRNGETPGIAKRNTRFLSFFDRFEQLEKATSEAFVDDPIHCATASLYAYYRISRRALRSLLDRCQRGQIGWRPKAEMRDNC